MLAEGEGFEPSWLLRRTSLAKRPLSYSDTFHGGVYRIQTGELAVLQTAAFVRFAKTPTVL